MTALLLAIGIGLHNFGEGLAIGAALRARRGGARHAAHPRLHPAQHDRGPGDHRPHRQEPRAARRLILLGVIGGAPTIAGAWLGGFVYSPGLAVLFLGLGRRRHRAGDSPDPRGVAGERRFGAYLQSAPALAGFFTGFAVMYSTGMLIQ